jgi:hypothetical protein
MREHARDRRVDARAQAPALGGNVNERNRRKARLLIHRL